jgi:hypothetical protein
MILMLCIYYKWPTHRVTNGVILGINPQKKQEFPMKSLIALLLLSSLSAFAQPAAKICDTMASVTRYTDRVESCREIVRVAHIDEGIIYAINAIAKKSSNNTLKALDAAINANYGKGVADLCTAVADNATHSKQILECVQVGANRMFPDASPAFCWDVATGNPAAAADCLDAYTTEYQEEEEPAPSNEVVMSKVDFDELLKQIRKAKSKNSRGMDASKELNEAAAILNSYAQ